MASKVTIGRSTQTRKIKINGAPGSKFELYVKKGSDYYNWDTDSFQTLEKKLQFQEIPDSGVYTKNIVIPEVSADTSYDFYVTAIGDTKMSIPTTHEQKIGVLYQKGGKTLTFTTTSSASLSISAPLTGGTVTNCPSVLTQAGTITKSGSPTPLIYIHETPSWNAEDGGNWTLSNYVEAIVVDVSGAVILLDDATGIVSGYSVVGNNIIDEITVSAVSGDKVTLSAGQDLKPGDSLGFSQGGWRVGGIVAEIEDVGAASGTTTVKINMTATVEEQGVADLTSVCSVDAFASIKPNAFPVTEALCPAGGELVIFPIVECTNYLGTKGDIDANRASKTYKVHSVPTADVTATRPYIDDDVDGGISYAVLGVAGTSSVSAGAAMGGAGVAEVTYTPHASMIEGDKDYFYYKTVDAQSSPQTSSLTQGKISITIV